MPWDEVKKQCYTMGFFVIGIGLLITLPHFIPNNSSVRVGISDGQLVLRAIPNPFDAVSLEAKAAYVYDVKQAKVLFAQNENEVMPLASVTKLMTALVGTKLIPDYNEVIISREALAQEGDSGLFVNERWRVNDLVDYTLLVSSNDGARALASTAGARVLRTELSSTTALNPQELFVAEMNREAQILGLTRTYFLNETGLDVGEGTAGAYGSARDMAHLIAYITRMYPEVLEATRYDSMYFESLNDLQHTATNTNVIAGAIPGLIGSKTGYTELAGGNLVITFDVGLGYPIVVSVLGSSIDGRFDDVAQLVQASINYVAAGERVQ